MTSDCECPYCCRPVPVEWNWVNEEVPDVDYQNRVTCPTCGKSFSVEVFFLPVFESYRGELGDGD